MIGEKESAKDLLWVAGLLYEVEVLLLWLDCFVEEDGADERGSKSLDPPEGFTAILFVMFFIILPKGLERKREKKKQSLKYYTKIHVF